MQKYQTSALLFLFLEFFIFSFSLFNVCWIFFFVRFEAKATTTGPSFLFAALQVAQVLTASAYRPRMVAADEDDDPACPAANGQAANPKRPAAFQSRLPGLPGAASYNQVSSQVWRKTHVFHGANTGRRHTFFFRCRGCSSK